MGLNANQIISLGGGGGNHINAPNLPLGGIARPIKGDFLVAIITAQFGLNTPTPSQPTFTLTDDANNLWINLYDIFNSSGLVGAYNGQFSTSVWICPSHNGNALNHISVTSTVVPDANDQEGVVSYSDWNLNYHAVDATPHSIITGATTTPQYPSFGIAANELVICSFWSPISGTNIPTAGPTGFTALNNSNPYWDYYIVRPANPTLQPSATFPTSTEPWMLAGLIVNISPPSVKPSQICFSRLPVMEIEE